MSENVRSDDGWGQRVSGRCPACGTTSLFVAVGQHITCGNIPCPDPCAVADFLLGERDALTRAWGVGRG